MEEEITEGGERTRKIWEIFLAYLPAIISAVCGVITAVLYTTTMPVQYWTVYFDQAFLPVVQFAIAFLNRKLNLGIPYWLIALMALHAILSVDMGTSLSYYNRYRWWDTFVHCMFGFLAAAVLYYLFQRIHGKKPNVFDNIAIFLIVLAFAAAWELFEYVMSIWLEQDMQDWQYLVSQGKNPLSDTMLDMTVAIIGAAVFDVVLLAVHCIRRLRERGSPSEGA